MRITLWFALSVFVLARSVRAEGVTQQILLWDAVNKAYTCRPGDKTAQFTFTATNISKSDVVILRASTSCGCTVAKLPSEPWVLKPGTSGAIHVTVDLANKIGTVHKAVFISISNAPMQTLTVEPTVSLVIPQPPAMSDEDRLRNVRLARANAQAIFKGDCAGCHVAPTKGRTGASLYAAACGICHDAGARQASMVPNLRTLKAANFDFWKRTIANGVTNSLMPGFAIANGGPLNEAQIDSLANYLDYTISRSSTAVSRRK